MRFISQAIMNHDLPHTISCITPDGEFFCPESCTEHLKLDVIRLALFKKEELEKELTKVDIGYIHHTQPNLITTARTNFSNAQEIYNIVKKAALHERTKATTR
ncbi:hypothetical protein KBC04_00970 [Candidatus Babeliales bacterium]|nr:hypothetical protein [Candidatus Babeliales bacterium]MBP9843693.1 hypothetical protein [Candidatus Babeliales bacterium]